MPAEGDDDRLVLGRQHRRLRLSWSCRSIGDRGSLLPLRYGLLVDAVAPRELPQALLTMLYRSTHCLCRAGAPMQNLSHSASFHSREKIAPSKSGIKHLEFLLRAQARGGTGRERASWGTYTAAR